MTTPDSRRLSRGEEVRRAGDSHLELVARSGMAAVRDQAARRGRLPRPGCTRDALEYAPLPAVGWAIRFEGERSVTEGPDCVVPQ